MENPNGEKTDGLEIISIGFLYKGSSWDKKYWSSSRGKDRYPYSVGYQAVRIHGGVTYRMEIQEGPKGPLFLIASKDGESCSGQTPDIAWERFQKKGGPRAKLGHGKRFSCKIDGTEFFGFKNPLVQRLLRELVANVNGTAHQNSISPSSNGAFDLEPEYPQPELCACPDMVSCPVKHQSSKKQKIKHRTKKINSISGGIKSLQHQDSLNDVDVSSNCMGNWMHNSGIDLTSNADNDCLACKESNALPVSADMVRYVEEGNYPLSVKEGIPLESSKLSASLSAGHLSQLEHKDVGATDARFTSLPHNLLERENHLDRSLTAETKGCKATEGNSGETVDSIESKTAKDLGISASGTWNLQKVKRKGYASYANHIDDSAEDCCKESPSQVEPDLEAPNRIISEEMATSLCSHKELSTHISNASSERIGFDSEGQDLTNSMMKVLLPQALTLLKKASSETKALVHGSEVSFTNTGRSLNLTGMKSPGKVGEIYPTEVISPGKLGVGAPSEGSLEKRETNIHFLGRNMGFDIQSSEVVESVIPDSLEDEQFRNNVNNQRQLGSNIVEVGEMTFDKKEHNFDCLSLLGCAGTYKEFSNFQSRNNRIFYDTDSQCLNNNTEKDGILASDSPTDDPSLKRETLLKGKVEDACSNWDDRQSYPGVNSTMYTSKKDLGIVNDPTQDIPAKAQSSHRASMVGCEVLNLIPPGGISHSSTSFQMKTEVNSKVAPFSSGTAYSQRVVTPNSMKNVETTSDGILETAVVQYHRRRCHYKDLNLQNGTRVHGNRSNYNTPDNHDDNDTYKLSENKDTKGASSICCASAVGNSEKESNILNGTSTKAGNASSFIQSPDFPPTVTYDGPLAESKICRNTKEDCLPEAYTTNESLLASEVVQVSASCNILDREISFRGEVKLEEQPEGLKNGTFRSKGLPTNSTSAQSMIVGATKEKVTSSLGDQFISDAEKQQTNASNELSGPHDLINCGYTSTLCQEGEISSFDLNKLDTKDILADLDVLPLVKPVSSNLLPHSKVHQESLLMDQMPPGMESDKETEGLVELVGCYMHPIPVLSMLLTTQGDKVHIAVLCGLLEERARTIFMYKIPIKKQGGGCPSFIGYTMMLPIMQDKFCKIESGMSALQFTPDCQCLVLPSSIKAPSCRKGSIDCSCSLCTSDCFGENAIKVVHVKLGYVSLVAKLMTVENVHGVLVCEPNHLVAVEESGRLHVWIMCTNWSAYIEEFVLPKLDTSSHQILELKRIPKSTSLIIGHNGTGHFGVWDLAKRMILSRFSAPGKSVFQVLPVGLFSWDGKEHVPTGPDVEDHIKGILSTTKMWFSKSSEELASVMSHWKDLAVWLLVSVGCDSEVQNNHQGIGINRSPEGCWRLALLVKNSVIFGSPLESRVTAINVSAGQAIIGTCYGHVYMWEMSTGRKLSDLHYFQGKRVSCIATDPQSGLVAVACKDCPLLIFTTRRVGEVK